MYIHVYKICTWRLFNIINQNKVSAKTDDDDLEFKVRFASPGLHFRPCKPKKDGALVLNFVEVGQHFMTGFYMLTPVGHSPFGPDTCIQRS